MYYRNKNPLQFSEFDPKKKDYSKNDLTEFADSLLRDDARTEMCRECNEEGRSERGVETGTIQTVPQNITDGEGTQLSLDFPEYECAHGHRWFKGEGKVRGIDGNSPILFEEHFQSRRRREIYTAVGTPDPSIVAGIYNRTHPQGRKVNSDAQRRTNGASFYR